MKKTTTSILALASIALTACAPVNTAQVGLQLADVPGIQDYRAEVEEFTPNMLGEFDAVTSHAIQGVEGTAYQTIGQTEGLEEWLKTYSQYAETSQDFERDWLACYVDNTNDAIFDCHNDILEAHGMD